jgi:hexosaminidase
MKLISKRHSPHWLFTCMVVLFIVQAHAQTTTRPALIPYPASLTTGKGEFIITPGTGIVYDTKDGFDQALKELSVLIPSGKSLPRPSTKVIELQKDAAITSPEGYNITITEQKVLLKASAPAGMFRAVQTIRQLLSPAIETKGVSSQNLRLPALTITDEPAYAWRGLHLDVSRHFFSISYIEKLIDAMALYKLNKLHLHLTDDQGWRVEIKKYPQLTEQGAWRTFDKNDSFCIRQQKNNPHMAIEPKHIVQRNGKTMYGGFYTQQQLKDLVKYAADRYIDIIPEVDMPGHMMAAIHAFPDLSCEGGSKWGELFSTPICPCKESTFEFAQNVFTEIMDIFPSEYIHLGADEVDRKTWAQSGLCKELMQKEGLKDVAELQSYFVKRMEKFFHSKGRKLIGWDEILEGGISPTANVMYWRSWVPNAPVVAARNGNKVIMSPGNPLYFDNLPDAHSLSNIYQFSVVPEKLTAEEGKFIIGAQANLWTERVPSENRADYLYFPRTLALAERVWSKQPDYTSFQQRLPAHYNRLEAMRILYRLPDLSGFAENNVFTDQAILDIKKPMPSLVLRYTTNGSLPVTTSPVLSKPLVIKQPGTIKVAAFTPSGLRGDIYTLNYKKEKFLEPVAVPKAASGLQARFYKKYFLNTLGMKEKQPDSQFIAANAAVPSGVSAPSFAMQYTGYINIPETGVYSFYLLVDDGGVLRIGDKEVVNNDGQHAPLEKSGQIALKKGLHPFKLDFIEGGGGFTLQLKYSKGAGSPMPIPDSFFKH